LDIQIYDFEIVSARPGAIAFKPAKGAVKRQRLQTHKLVTCNPGLGQGFRNSNFEFYVARTRSQNEIEDNKSNGLREWKETIWMWLNL
jgi:hypothetical protein